MFKNRRNFIICLSLLYLLFVSCVGVSEYRHMISAPEEKIVAVEPGDASQTVNVSMNNTQVNKAAENTNNYIDRNEIKSQETPITPSRAKPIIGLPILMYHEIGDGPNSLYVPENNFRAQMKYLHTNGFTVVTLSKARDLIYNKDYPAKVVAITFDDGYASFYSKAWPILKEYGFPATLFVCSQLVGGATYCKWDEIKELHAAGIEIGSHSQTHPSLPSLDNEKLAKEITDSKKDLEQNLNTTITTFCYPAGEYDQRCVEALSNAGYNIAVTTRNRKATAQDYIFLIPRIRVPSWMNMETFAKSVI